MPEMKLITCVMHEKVAQEIIEYLQDEMKILTANKYSARGTSYIDKLESRQMDVLTVVVDASVADEVFEYIYKYSKVNEPHGGMIFQEKLGRCSSYELPNL